MFCGQTVTVCGWPGRCKCDYCTHRKQGKSGNFRGSHECALQYAQKCQPPKSGWYDVEMESQRKAAWADQGYPEPPKFFKLKKKSGYYWPEEMQTL